MPNKYKLGIDIGGTFTDIILLDEGTGETVNHKVPSTPRSPSRAVVRGIREVMGRVGVSPQDVSYFVHGTTIAVNTIIERTGAKVGLLVTQGDRDILTIARLRIPSTFSLVTQVPQPLVPRSHVREVRGRMLASGEALEDLREEDVYSAVQELSWDGVQSWAVCFLNSFVNPTHEHQIARIIRETLGDVHVSLSCELWPEIREYERAMVTIMNAYILPRMVEYLDALQEEMAEVGLTVPLFISKSNGGIMTASSACQAPVETVLSGPAAGVMGASFVARLTGEKECIAIDIGGTSVDVSVILDGSPLYSMENHVADFPVIMPSVDVSSIGAGGGSIAWMDQLGVLKVGPKSAGADPGPSCYGLGGTEPTITDCYLVCGYLNPENFLGGEMKLDRSLAEKALEPIAQKLTTGVLAAAESVLRVATANMSAELFPLMTMKGIDPRACTLIAYGGAGPTHACIMADEVGIKRVVIPPSPGTLCALGTLINDVKKDYIRTIKKDVASLDISELWELYRELEERALAWLKEEGPIVQETILVESADMRYKGQAYEINVALSDSGENRSLAGIAELFHSKHEQIYRQCDREAAVEIVNLRVEVIGKPPPLVAKKLPRPASTAQPVAAGKRNIYYQGRSHEAQVFHRKDLLGGHSLKGPAIVEQTDTTTIILPGWVGRVDEYGHITIERI